MNDEDDSRTTPFVRGELPVKPTADTTADPYRSPGLVKAAGGGGSMFGNFSRAKNRKAPPWAAPLLSGVVALHVVMFVSMWIKSIWEIEMLERPKMELDLAMAPPPPPP